MPGLAVFFTSDHSDTLPATILFIGATRTVLNVVFHRG